MHLDEFLLATVILLTATAPLGAIAQPAPVEPGDVIRMALYRADGGGSMSTQVTAVVQTRSNRNDCLGVRIETTATSAAAREVFSW